MGGREAKGGNLEPALPAGYGVGQIDDEENRRGGLGWGRLPVLGRIGGQKQFQVNGIIRRKFNSVLLLQVIIPQQLCPIFRDCA